MSGSVQPKGQNQPDRAGGARDRGRAQNRADRFWAAFSLTENGKPKSGFLIYTFSLSFAYLAVYALCYSAGIACLTRPLSALPVWCANLVISLICSLAGAALCCLPHRFFRDKRLVFGAHLWLALYAAAVLIAMLILLRGGGLAAFLEAYLWFAAIPVAVGTAASGLLWRHARANAAPEPEPEPEPEWKKYVNRR